MNVIVTDIMSYKDVMVDVAIATLQSTHFIYQFEVFFAANSLINLKITQLLHFGGHCKGKVGQI